MSESVLEFLVHIVSLCNNYAHIQQDWCQVRVSGPVNADVLLFLQERAI